MKTEDNEKKKRGIPRSEKKLKRELMECVLGVVRDESAKPTERLTAVKTMMDYFVNDKENGESGEVRVVFENLPEGFAE
ncbi:MAG: hypothetical protein IIT70_08850 [Clostridia bacterium]|nr:hypothetical protein [Clostridia bacterium]MBR4636885.1 hypothetical protein [Clostridia bacterium]